MFVSEELIFLQLQKAAGTHIAFLLQRHLGGELRGKHGPLDFDPGGRVIVGSVRNPWDWYVSLWAYGCGTQGAVQGLLQGNRMRSARRIVGAAGRRPGQWGAALRDLIAHSGRDVAFWREVYADPHDAEAFRSWLRAVLSPQGRRLLGADYASRPLSGCAGFYTYRFLKTFTPAVIWTAHSSDIRRHVDIAPFFEAHGAPHMMVRNERLEEDLAQVFSRIDRCDVTVEVLRSERTNTSRRDKVERYYDTETIALVAENDSFIGELFGYAPPVHVKAIE